MENRGQGEVKLKSAGAIVDSMRSWAHDHLTLQGREEQAYLKKYTQIVEHLPKDMNESQLALMEIRLRNQAHSKAIGSIIIDGLVAGGALVGTGVLLNKVDFKFPKFERTVPRVRVQKPRTESVTVPRPATVQSEPRWSLMAFARKVSRILEGHGEDIDLNKVSDSADRVLDGIAKVKWDAPADWTEKGMEKAGAGLKKLWGWLDGGLEKLADNM